MSATPRPWQRHELPGKGTGLMGADGSPVLWGDSEYLDGLLEEEDADLICHAVNAFDALLAVAKAAHKNETYSSDSRNSEELNMLLAELDVAHPGWREWPTGAACTGGS